MTELVRSRLIIVSGAPASGKTTLAERLAAELGYPLLTKDLIKESLFDVLGSRDREQSRQLSLAAYGVLYRIGYRLVAAGTSLVLESNFQKGISEKELLPLVERSRAVLIHCATSTDTLVRRYNQRATSRQRHPGHHDGPLGPDELKKLTSGIYEPISLAIPIQCVNTTDRYSPEYSEILEFAKSG